MKRPPLKSGTHRKARQICNVPASPVPFIFPDKRLWFGANSCCSISYLKLVSEFCQIEYFVFSSLTAFPCYSLL